MSQEKLCIVELVGWLVGWSVVWLVDWLVGWLISSVKEIKSLRSDVK
jgi:hypothetical protein